VTINKLELQIWHSAFSSELAAAAVLAAIIVIVLVSRFTHSIWKQKAFALAC
jgi:hypothetical protein